MRKERFQVEPPKLGLRERKKLKTRLAIQQQALRLFREQGYEATTVAQIAEVAEISESTFFRYFPTKEEVVMWDDFDPYILEAIKFQPKNLTPLKALRAAFRQVLSSLSSAARKELRERVVLMLSVPPLRATLFDQIGGPMQRLATVVAERTGRKPHDPAVRTLVGAVIGVGLAVMFRVADDAKADVVVLLDEALGQLEAGLRL
jgi:AcrR family transcriptional regulator